MPWRTFSPNQVVSETNAWPRALSSIDTTNSKAEFVKRDGLRKKEIFAPLVQINSGSKWASEFVKRGISFVLGITAGIVAGSIIYYFTN